MEKKSISLKDAFMMFIITISMVGLALIVLHGIEAALWAAMYVQLGALNSFGDAIFYAIDAMTTRGASNLALQENWQIMGALESADGVLLFGMSTAFMFAAMQRGFSEIIEAKKWH